MHCNSKVDLAFNFLQVNRDDDTVRPSFQDYAQDLKVSIFLLEDSGTCSTYMYIVCNWSYLRQLCNLIGHDWPNRYVLMIIRLLSLYPLTDYQVNVSMDALDNLKHRPSKYN